VITPFHFACHVEERLRAQFQILDPALGAFVQISRRFSLTENRAALQFGKKTSAGEEFAPHVTFLIQLVPQKDEKTALNCSLECCEPQTQKGFRLLLNAPDEAEPQILKVLSFLQNSFMPLGYTTSKPKKIPTEAVEDAAAIAGNAMETAHALVRSAGGTTPAEDLSAEAAAVTGGKKYIYENAAKGETVRMRTYDGKYVPDGELPARLRVNGTKSPIPADAATPATPVAATATPVATTPEVPAPTETAAAAAAPTATSAPETAATPAAETPKV